ncbi:MAG: hypothetical protein Q8Q94_00685 [bacterium]|nr:hypothetical protein [bacterium]
MEVTKLFLQLLETQGWVSWISHGVWDAHQAGLLPDVSVGGNCPENLRLKLQQNVPYPTFFEEDQWNSVLDYCGMRSGNSTAYVSDRTNTYYIKRATIAFFEDKVGYDVTCRKERRKNFRRYGLPVTSMHVTHLIVGCAQYTAAHFAELRDQIMLRLNQGDPGDIVKIAKILKIS